METEVEKSAYSIKLELPSYATISQCQHLLDEICKHKVVRSALFIIECGDSVQRYFSRKNLPIEDVKAEVNESEAV